MLPRRPALSKVLPCIIYLQHTGDTTVSSDVISVFDNECVALSSGVKGLVSNDQINQYTSDTAIWYYTQAKRKPYIWKDTILFGTRLFKSVNTAVFKEKIRLHIPSDVLVDLLVVRISTNKIISYDLNRYAIFLLRRGSVSSVTMGQDDETSDMQPAALGNEEEVQPRVVIKDMQTNDVYLFVPKEIRAWLNETDIAEIMIHQTKEELQHLMERAKAYGGEEIKTIVMVKAQSVFSHNF